MEALFVSTGVVALSEMGDKTQLLALLLAARFKRPLPIFLGILIATVANHALAALAGAWLAAEVGPVLMRWIVGLTFLAMAVWVLVPDRVDVDAAATSTRFGVFGTTLIAFFVAEMGDKTQIATVALAANFGALTGVVVGSTLGMMLANAPAVFLGDAVTRRVPLRLVRTVAGGIFAVLGVATLCNVDSLF